MELSVIIPAHNEEKCIAATLKAIPADIEAIVVCNACTDSTFDAANSVKREKLKVFNIPEKGVSKARNFGAKMASHARIVFLDADVVPETGLFEMIAVCGCSIGTCNAKPNIKKFVPEALMKLKNLTHRFGTCTGLIFCTKEMFEKAGGFDESLELGEDGKFLRAAKKEGKYGVVNAYVTNNMRRFEQMGYAGVCWFWVKNYFCPRKKKYEVIR